MMNNFNYDFLPHITGSSSSPLGHISLPLQISSFGIHFPLAEQAN